MPSDMLPGLLVIFGIWVLYAAFMIYIHVLKGTDRMQRRLDRLDRKIYKIRRRSAVKITKYQAKARLIKELREIHGRG